METKGLSRRRFLQALAGSAAAAVAVSVSPWSVAAQEMTYQEAPMLADLVASGALPPVAERIPANPRVVTPLDEIGEYGGTLRRAWKGISDRWGPTKLNEEMAIEWDIPDTETVNVVANYISGWEQNDNATEFTFTLRDGIRWSDGHLFTTDDVKFWYDEYYMGELQAQEVTLTLGGVQMVIEIVDPLTWKATFPKPNPLLPLFIAKLTLGEQGGPTMAMPKHYLSQYISHLTTDQSLIDDAMKKNGVETWQQLHGDGSIVLEGPILAWYKNPERPVINAWMASNEPTNDPWLATRNPYYHAVDPKGKQYPYLDGWTHAWFDDNSVFDLWVAQGLIDAQIRQVNTANFTFYKENEDAGDYKVLIWKNASTNAFFPNISSKDAGLRALFDNARFREALSVAINRDEINDLIYTDLYTPRQASPVTGSPNFDPDFASKWIEFNPDRANQLLDEIGLTQRGDDGFRLRPDGTPLVITILFQTGFSGIEDEVTLVEKYWEAVGLNINQELVERSLYTERVSNGDVDVGVWTADRNIIPMADPSRYTGQQSDGPWAPLYGAWWAKEPRASEEPPADHPIREIWRLWEATQSEPDEAKRNELFTQMLGIHKEHPYMLGTVGESPQLFIVKNNVGNIQAGHVWDDTLRSPGGVNPITWYFKA
ncbi:MAG: ABC transporter substrate-binding protein [Chloroflexota bacterium]